MYKKVDPSLNFVDREQEILDFWNQNEIFKKSRTLREDAPAYTFYDGPPTANGKPHIGHILTRSMKDIIPRYRTMKGFNVLRKAGWDTHGLPVELEVEKALGLDGKEQIEAYGVEPFIEECKKSVWKYKGEWEEMSDRVGFWADMEHPYITYDNDYIESVWWAIKTISDKGLLYKGHKIVPYCPRCGTALSSHELAQGYKDVRETSIFVKFPCKELDAAFLAWTTTPWTLPSNVALCVNKKEEYVMAEHNGERLILAAALVKKALGEDAQVTVIETFRGEELVGKTYEPLFDFPVNHNGKTAWRIVEDDYVTLTDGSGIVHIAPAFGEDDSRVGRRFDLPFVQTVDERGRMTEETPWAGTFVKDADKDIIRDLKASGKLFSELKFEHSYPFCWRCDTPLIYYARESWFIKMTAVREKLLDYNRRINWIPENIRDGRMGNFLENVIDWGVSRERYWGTPLPVWTCSDCGHIHVIGSRDELAKCAGEEYRNVELHKPFLDKITFPCDCDGCSGTMHRESAVIDCWFDSGSMPFAQWHYPFENKEEFLKRYPADYISEAVDQTRGWFYTLNAIAALIFDEPAFLNCLVLGLVQDKDGIKMSKHKGNVINPWDVLNRQGADAVRWYYYVNSNPWLPNRFSHEAVSEAQRKYLGTLWNTYAFYILYAGIDKFDPTEHTLKYDNLSVMDKWLLSRLNTLIKTVDKNLEHYRITESARELLRFADELSNWYVRRCRERFWGSEMTADKEAAYMTLYTTLLTIAKLTAPFTPFMAEMIYRNMECSVNADAPESIHLCNFPESDSALIDTELEENMDAALNIVVLGRSARNAATIKNRQPLLEMFIQGRKLPDMFTDIIANELNVKRVTYTDDATGFISYRVKPQLKTLGPRYGKLLPKISAYLQGDGIGNDVVATHAKGEVYSFEIDGTEVSLSAEDVLVETQKRDGFVSESHNDLTVVLSTELTEELIDEGFVREIVSKVQTMRKEAGYSVTDHIRLSYEAAGRSADVLARFGNEIASDVLADEIVSGVTGFIREWDINGETVVLGVERV